MRQILSSAVLTLLPVLSVFGASSPPKPATLTIVLDFQGERSARSVTEMEQEAARILKSAGLELNWRSRSDATAESYDDLVVVHFRGKCVLEPVPYLYDERGPLAFTYSTEGSLQPFSEVACDRITASVRSAMFSGDYKHADQLMGRAMGRVLAHEVVHMLSRSPSHGHEGVTRPALSGRQLIAEHLALSPEEMERLRALPR
jgi:hypothetical protein